MVLKPWRINCRSWCRGVPQAIDSQRRGSATGKLTVIEAAAGSSTRLRVLQRPVSIAQPTDLLRRTASEVPVPDNQQHSQAAEGVHDVRSASGKQAGDLCIEAVRTGFAQSHPSLQDRRETPV